MASQGISYNTLLNVKNRQHTLLIMNITTAVGKTSFGGGVSVGYLTSCTVGTSKAKLSQAPRPRWVIMSPAKMLQRELSNWENLNLDMFYLTAVPGICLSLIHI